MQLFLVGFLLLLSAPTHAQSAKAESSPMLSFLKESCAQDISTFCSALNEPRSTMMCLAQNKEKLSNPCKEGLQRMLQASQQAQARGGGALASLGGMNSFSPPVPLVVVEGRVYPANQTPRLTDYRLNLTTPVYRTEQETVSVSAAYGHLNFQEPVTLDSGTVVPTNLRRVEIGAQYFQQLQEKRSWGLRGSIGYAGDTVFENSRDMSFSMSGNYSFPSTEQSSWVLTAFFSNNSPIGNFIPIPGFIYIYRTEKFTGLFGIPITAVQWTPVHPWSFSFSLFGPTVNSEVGYGSVEKMQLFTGFQWTQQLYLLEARVNEEDRLRLEEKRLLLGVRTPLFQKLGAEFQIGHGYDRSVYIGDGLFNDDGGNRDLDRNTYFNVVLRAVL